MKKLKKITLQPCEMANIKGATQNGTQNGYWVWDDEIQSWAFIPYNCYY